MTAKALQGVKVIEYSQGISGPYCTKLMADLGADVIKIEQPGTGDLARHIGPFAGKEAHPEKSIIFLYVNTNKKGITLDLDQPEGIEIFKELVKDATVFIKDGQPEWYDQRGIGYDDLSKINPGLIMASLTPYGESGPYKDYVAHPLNTSHMSMAASMFPHGSPDYSRAPTMIGGNFEQYDLGIMAAAGLLGAIFYRLRTGEGQYMELSALDTTAALFNTETVVYEMYGFTEERQALMLKSMGCLTAPCKDGYVCPFLVQPNDFRRMAKVIGKDEWVDEPWLVNKLERVKRIDEVRQALLDWLKDKTKAEASSAFQKVRVAIGPVETPKDVVESEQFNVRGYFTELEHPVVGRYKFPGRPFIFEKTPMTYAKSAPLLGEDNKEVYLNTLGLSKEYIDNLQEKNVI